MFQDTSLLIGPGCLDLDLIRSVRQGGIPIRLGRNTLSRIKASSRLVADVLAHNEPVYGITTGFGSNAHVRIAADQAAELQKRLILSHAAGVGARLSDETVRLMLLLKINALAQGYSGVSCELVQALVKLLNADVLPCIPSKGSVGASGDLAPLAHIGAALMGIGEVRSNGCVVPALEALNSLGLSPYAWGPKEALSLINGTQASTAIALDALLAAEDVFVVALVAGALSVEAAFGAASPFDQRIHEVRRQLGQISVARIYRELLSGGERRAAGTRSVRTQDPYSLRCQPQVMGACLDQMRSASAILLREANGVSDNPYIFPTDDGFEILSGGNFHAEPVAMAADNMALAIAEIGAMSERRVALLVDSRFSGLAPFLAITEGLDSGFMIAHVTAAALASENKALAHPSSVDSLPTSANQEDHVSMATNAARRLGVMLDNTAYIVAIELLAACQGVDLHPEPGLAPKTMLAYEAVRRAVPAMKEDRFLAPDLEHMRGRLFASGLQALISEAILPGDAVPHAFYEPA